MAHFRHRHGHQDSYNAGVGFGVVVRTMTHLRRDRLSEIVPPPLWAERKLNCSELALTTHYNIYGKAYKEESAEAYEQQRQERERRALERRAKKLGYILTQAEEQPVAAAT